MIYDNLKTELYKLNPRLYSIYNNIRDEKMDVLKLEIELEKQKTKNKKLDKESKQLDKELAELNIQYLKEIKELKAAGLTNNIIDNIVSKKKK